MSSSKSSSPYIIEALVGSKWIEVGSAPNGNVALSRGSVIAKENKVQVRIVSRKTHQVMAITKSVGSSRSLSPSALGPDNSITRARNVAEGMFALRKVMHDRDLKRDEYATVLEAKRWIKERLAEHPRTEVANILHGAQYEMEPILYMKGKRFFDGS